MSSYFDAWGQEQHRIQGIEDEAERREVHRQHELKLVYDVTLCVEWPGCPVEIRDAAYQVMLKFGVQSLPSCFGFSADNPEVDTEEDEWKSIGRMAYELHTIFHALGAARIRPFTDHPLAPLNDLAGEGEERRLSIAKAAAGWVEQTDEG